MKFLISCAICLICLLLAIWGEQNTVLAQNRDSSFYSFTKSFSYTSLPLKIDVSEIFCCSERPHEIDSTLAHSFLPVADFEAGTKYYFGPLAWDSRRNPFPSNEHIALIWYTSSFESINDEYFGFISTFTINGTLISNEEISYFYSHFNGESAEWSWINDWGDRWSFLKGNWESHRSLQGHSGGFSGYELYEAKEDGFIRRVIR